MKYEVTYLEDTVETRRYSVVVEAGSLEEAKAAALEVEREDDEDGTWVHGETQDRTVSAVQEVLA